MTNKITIKDYFMELRTLAERAERDDLIKFVDSRIAQVDAKNASRAGKMTKNQVANVELMDAIYARMEPEKAYRVSEISRFDFLADFTSNKVNALVRGLKLDGRVNRTEEKGIAYFTKI